MLPIFCHFQVCHFHVLLMVNHILPSHFRYTDCSSSYRFAFLFYQSHLALRDPFEAMTGRTAFTRWSPSSGFPFFINRKINAWRSMHSPRYPLIVILIISWDRRNWRDTRDKWSLAKNSDRSWWHRHTGLELYGRSLWLLGQLADYRRDKQNRRADPCWWKCGKN